MMKKNTNAHCGVHSSQNSRTAQRLGSHLHPFRTDTCFSPYHHCQLQHGPWGIPKIEHVFTDLK